jgi:outer membrane protein insertion porin family
METTGGHYISFSEEYAGLGGNREFLRSILNMRYYKRIWGDLVFRSKAEGGNIYDYSHRGVQTNERFYLGGANNLRGYLDYSIGPQDEIGGQNYFIGGLNQFHVMAELEHPLVKDVGLKAVIFYDAGDVFNRFNEVGVHQDYGWGLRWFSPLGPLRFEWGVPIKREGDTRFNFMIGPPF